MKTIKISLAVIALAIASLGMVKPESSSEKFANELINSFRLMSRENFGKLFPTLNEFYQVMDANKEFYGEDLEAAKQEFADEYNHRIAPGIIEAYESVQHSAATMKIDWNSVSIIRVTVDEGLDMERRKMTIYFSTAGDTHRLFIDGAFELNGEWRASGNMKLI